MVEKAPAAVILEANARGLCGRSLGDRVRAKTLRMRGVPRIEFSCQRAKLDAQLSESLPRPIKGY